MNELFKARLFNLAVGRPGGGINEPPFIPNGNKTFLGTYFKGTLGTPKSNRRTVILDRRFSIKTYSQGVRNGC